MFTWDDVKHFLAVARNGSTIAAAKALKQNQSTVQRRLAALEKCLGTELFEKTRNGYKLSSDGLDLLPFAEKLEAAADSFENRTYVQHRASHGVVRLTGPEPVMIRIVRAGILDRFNARVRLLDTVPELTRSWRILTHPNVRDTATVSAFFDFVNHEVKAFAPILSG
jgi:DNA-binding transcriptional LysR family regulator